MGHRGVEVMKWSDWHGNVVDGCVVAMMECTAVAWSIAIAIAWCMMGECHAAGCGDTASEQQRLSIGVAVPAADWKSGQLMVGCQWPAE